MCFPAGKGLVWSWHRRYVLRTSGLLGKFDLFKNHFIFCRNYWYLERQLVRRRRKKKSSLFFLQNCANYQENWICLSYYSTPSSDYKKLFCGKSWIRSWICSVTESLLDIGPDNFSPYVSISLQMRDNDDCPWGQGRALMHPWSTWSCCKEHSWAPARHSCSCGSALGEWFRDCCFLFSCQYLHLCPQVPLLSLAWLN